MLDSETGCWAAQLRYRDIDERILWLSLRCPGAASNPLLPWEFREQGLMLHRNVLGSRHRADGIDSGPGSWGFWQGDREGRMAWAAHYGNGAAMGIDDGGGYCQPKTATAAAARS